MKKKKIQNENLKILLELKEIKNLLSFHENIENKKKTLYHKYKHRLLIPILLSLISACIFWMTFDYMPRKFEYNKIRPKISHGIYDISQDMFFVFNTIMKNGNNSGCDFQTEIFSGRITMEEIEIGLQNKCVNLNGLRDPSASQFMISIGEELHNSFLGIDSQINDLYYFNDYLSADEILLLEQIRKTMFVYDLSDYNKVNNDLVPGISYMKENIYDFYQLYCKVLPIIFEEKPKYIPINIYQDIAFLLHEVDYHLYISQDYRRCMKAIVKIKKMYPDHSVEYSVILCEYLLGVKDAGFEAFKNLLGEKKMKLKYHRGLINIISKYDSRVENWLNENFSNSEVIELNDLIQIEKRSLDYSLGSP